MKTRPSLVGLLLMTLAVSTPSRADLFIQELWVSAEAGGDYNESYYTPADPFDPPYVISTAASAHEVGRSLQTKSGFFRDFAYFNAGFSGGGSHHSIEAQSTFYLVVGANTPNSPLVLDFNFLGAHVSGSSYYGQGAASASVKQTIYANRGTNNNVVTWAFEASIELQSEAWTNRYSWTDPDQIGIPQVALTPHSYDTTGSHTGLKFDLAAFVGRLDFGFLQPGEFFKLEYEATAEVDGMLPFGGFMEAELIDPFTLGGPPLPQLSLQGLTLPPTPVIEPRLKIALVDNEHARITWPTNAAGYALQFTPYLPALAWTTITNPPTVIGDRFALIVDTIDGSRFYRLR